MSTQSKEDENISFIIIWIFFLSCLGNDPEYQMTEDVQNLYKPSSVSKTDRKMGRPGIVCCFRYFLARTMSLL